MSAPDLETSAHLAYRYLSARMRRSMSVITQLVPVLDPLRVSRVRRRLIPLVNGKDVVVHIDY